MVKPWSKPIKYITVTNVRHWYFTGKELFKYNASVAWEQEPGELCWYSDGLRAGRSRFESGKGQNFSLLQSVQHIQPPIQRVLGEISPGLKRPGREADQSSPLSAEIKNGGAVTLLPHIFMD
jgi:hypothetical protein